MNIMLSWSLTSCLCWSGWWYKNNFSFINLICLLIEILYLQNVLCQPFLYNFLYPTSVCNNYSFEDEILELFLKVQRWRRGEVFPGDRRYPKKYMTSCKMMPPYSLSFESFLMILFSLFSTIDAKKECWIFVYLPWGRLWGMANCSYYSINCCHIHCVPLLDLFEMQWRSKCRRCSRTENRRYNDAEATSRGWWTGN